MSESTELTAEEAREIVTETAQKNGWVRPGLRQDRDPKTLELLKIIDGIREQLGDAVETIARDIYSLKARFILELIQNAEDNQFTRTKQPPSLVFEVHPNKIVVECNEDGFTKANVVSICRTGASSKKSQRGYIGEKGIGFKSVFQVASSIHIQSNSFSFSFHYNGGSSSEEKLGLVTPVPEDDPIPLSDRPLTRMTLTPIKSIKYDELLAQFEAIPDNLLLFLSTLKELKIKIHHSNEKTTVTTFRKSEDLTAGITKLIKTVETLQTPEEKAFQETRYHIFKQQISDLPADNARPDINECEVVLAFQIDEESNPVISRKEVFAFLPIRSYGFSFLVQADFILQANRQDIVDSRRNRAILDGVASTFCDAVLEFCESDSPLRFQWMRWLPPRQARDEFWGELFSDIIKLLSEESILYPHGSWVPRCPEDLRTLAPSQLDRNDLPLFEDRPGNRKYLSRRYDSSDIKILKEAFALGQIGDGSMFQRIKQDLDSNNSKIRAFETDNDWQTRAFDLILSILHRSPSVREKIRSLPLIPLIDGRWVNASTPGLCFPPETGPEVPRDLMITVDPRATRNNSRKEMLKKLGVERCSHTEIISRLWTSYRTEGRPSNLLLSKTHLSYLYWHYQDIDDRKFLRLWLYDQNERKITSRQKVIYFQSEDEYGPRELLKSVRHPRNPSTMAPECPVSFINSAYMDLFAPGTLRHELSWLSWLEKALGVRRIPRLKSDGGSLSQEFRHIMEYRPEKLIGTLKTHWAMYENEMSPPLIETLSRTKVICKGNRKKVLKTTYLPLPSLRNEVQALGVFQSFPFLDVPDDLEERRMRRDWRFLEEFGVGFEANLAFYVDILRQYEAQTQQPWGDEARQKILKTYELIAHHCSDNNTAWLIEEFDKENLILDPQAFEASANAPSWVDIEGCVWRGPVNLLHKTPLASVSQYRDNETLVRFFCQILGIKNANWGDYRDMLCELKDDPSPLHPIDDKVLRLYQLFSTIRPSNSAWAEISDAFEEDGLIYMPSTSEWFPPSECLWTSPVQIDGKAIVSRSYPEELKTFFLERLRISPASLSTLVEELQSLADRQPSPSVSKVKEMIWAINKMEPKQGDLDILISSEILPIRRPGSSAYSSNIFQSCQNNFAIIDRTKLAEIFDGYANFLDFTLEEVRQLYPFIHALDLERKYLSVLCDEQTACGDNGSVDRERTAKFKERAYDLLCCAFSYRSPLATRSSRSLYERLLNTTVSKTNGLTTQYTLHQTTGDKIIPVPQGYVHVQERDDRWEIFVPQNRRDRELCYMRQLPEALCKFFQIDSSAREIISNTLNSSSLVMDNLLEAAGIGKVSEVQPPPRPSIDESDEETVAGEETVETEVATAHLRDSRAQSAPLLSSRTGSAQGGSSVLASLGHRTASSISTSDSRAQTPISSTTPPENRGTPASRIFGFPSPGLPQGAGNIFHRGRSQEDVTQGIFARDNAYRELLDNVIRIASRTTLPRYGVIARHGNGQLHQGVDLDVAFGVRSQGQMNHDIRIGAAGELFAFEILLNRLPSSFGRHNWKSTIRKEVVVHPKYSDMTPWEGAETADITFIDIGGNLTSLMIQWGYLDERVWSGVHPRYYIEVKTTTRDCNERFFMSNSQYLRMQRMTLTPGQSAGEIYVVFRVYNLGKDSLNVKLYVDPEAHRLRNELAFEAQSWTVTPRP